MTKALKVVMIVYAAVLIVFGLAFIVAPDQLADVMAFPKPTDSLLYVMVFLGVSWIIVPVFIIMAAVRDPLKRIMWVQLEIAWAILNVAVEASSWGRGIITFSQASLGFIDLVAAIALLSLYPWRARGSVGDKPPTS